MAREIVRVRVRVWQSGLALIDPPPDYETHLQPADNALRTALAGKHEGYFEAQRSDAGDWIIGAEVEP